MVFEVGARPAILIRNGQMGESQQVDQGHDPLIGKRLGGYIIEKPLGRGSMGTVYRARQVTLDRPVALKAMSASLAARGDLVARFLASRARRDEPASPLRTATFWHSSMTIRSQRDLSR